MSALPEPSDAIRALRMLTAAEIVTRAAALTGHGKDLFIGTVISYADPLVRDAALAALGGAEAGQGLTGEPGPAGTRPAGTAYSGEDIARVCHEANRALQLANGEEPSPHWAAAPNSQRNSSVAGVHQALAGRGAEELHEAWADRRRALGWRHGPVKDEQMRTHPCLVPYADLPEAQRVKDRLFHAIVAVLAGPGEEPPAAETRPVREREAAELVPQTRAAHGRKLLADLDRAEAEHRATARVPYLPLPGVVDGEVVDRLIDPDCRAGKCGSCVGGPCEHECHGGAA